jgi:hypothetical protein
MKKFNSEEELSFQLKFIELDVATATRLEGAVSGDLCDWVKTLKVTKKINMILSHRVIFINTSCCFLNNILSAIDDTFGFYAFAHIQKNS